MVAPDGEVLANCNKEKVQWYLEKDLAEIICQDPLTIRLKFEPNGRKNRDQNDLYDDSFYVAERENKCVVCGTK